MLGCPQLLRFLQLVVFAKVRHFIVATDLSNSPSSRRPSRTTLGAERFVVTTACSNSSASASIERRGAWVNPWMRRAPTSIGGNVMQLRAILEQNNGPAIWRRRTGRF